MQPPIPDPHTLPQTKPRFWFAFWQMRWYMLPLLLVMGLLAIGLMQRVTEDLVLFDFKFGIVTP
jgi:hypothetical protein